MFKNTASQKWMVFAYNSTTGAAVTGDAANITANIRVDYVTQAVDDTNPTELEIGYYEFDLAQAETNGDILSILPESSTSNVAVIGCPRSLRTVTTDNLLTEASLVDAVWDELATDHETAGTMGALLE